MLLTGGAAPAPSDVEAAFQLGLRAELGRSQKANPVLAYHWYRIAAQAGYAPAELNVAIMQDSGRGAAHDARGAAEWYARAAARGDRRAQYNLALLYEAGEGVPRNPQAAAAWFRMAAASGLQAAANRPLDVSMATTLSAATPTAPHSGASVTQDADGNAEFVWTAPFAGPRARYFLQVVALEPGGSREIYGRDTDVTAALVRLDQAAHLYAWRVYTIAGDAYAVSAWARFSS